MKLKRIFKRIDRSLPRSFETTGEIVDLFIVPDKIIDNIKEDYIKVISNDLTIYIDRLYYTPEVKDILVQHNKNNTNINLICDKYRSCDNKMSKMVNCYKLIQMHTISKCIQTDQHSKIFNDTN